MNLEPNGPRSGFSDRQKHPDINLKEPMIQLKITLEAYLLQKFAEWLRSLVAARHLVNCVRV
jgi:hypothetical protein